MGTQAQWTPAAAALPDVGTIAEEEEEEAEERDAGGSSPVDSLLPWSRVATGPGRARSLHPGRPEWQCKDSVMGNVYDFLHALSPGQRALRARSITQLSGQYLAEGTPSPSDLSAASAASSSSRSGSLLAKSSRGRRAGSVLGAVSSWKSRAAASRLLHNKAAALYGECLGLALCRLRATAAPRASEPQDQQHQGLVHAWPHALLAPLLWLPFSLLREEPTKVVLPSREKAAKRAFKHLTTMEVKLVGSSPREELAETEAPEDEAELGPAALAPRLREAFQQAVSEARLAEAQAVAAQKDVQRLQAALERLRRSAQQRRAKALQVGAACRGANGPSKEWTCASGGGAAALKAEAARASPAAVAQLKARRDQLKRAEAYLSSELQEVERQNQRLLSELQRRQERHGTAGAAPASVQAAVAAAAAAALPEIGCPQTPRQGPRTPRTTPRRTPGRTPRTAAPAPAPVRCPDTSSAATSLPSISEHALRIASA
mmetsp:Transcript_5364/g.16738  ORF Transcript_5364/g.16738 Transcript_5364/m.16738 type:complete len:489 (+) Transcript_5364:44-1510(+)